MNSINSSTACGLQQIIDKFSPLKNQSFENKYIQKRSVERQRTQSINQEESDLQSSPMIADTHQSSVCPTPMNIAHVVPQPIQHQYQMPPRIMDAQQQSKLKRDIIMREAEDQINRIQSKLNDNYQRERNDKSMLYENEVEMFD